jgi:diguanylate cyclase (GGDEF)-like protein
VVVISGDDEPDVRVKAKSAGATDFISKSIGNVELLARLEALTQLARTADLEESRAALATVSPTDPASGLATPSYLHYHAAQELSLAHRRHGDLSVMVIEIDQFDNLIARYGAHVAQLVNRKLSKILATKLRQEDTVAELAPARFVIVSPATNMDGACAFAMRLRTAIDHIVMTYREERIRIQITIGLAAAEPGRTQTVSHLIGVAMQRIAVGRAEGGNRVMGAKEKSRPRCQRTGPRTGQHRPIPPSATHGRARPRFAQAASRCHTDALALAGIDRIRIPFRSAARHPRALQKPVW